MISFLKLIRYKNLLMVFLTMFLTKYALIGNLTLGIITHFDFDIIVFSVLLITAGGYIINDIYDVDADRINKPTKVYVGNSISFKNAWISYGTLTILGVIFGTYISYKYQYSHNYSFFFIFSALGLFLYSKYLKGIPLVGNMIVSIFVGLSIYIISLFEFPKGGVYELINHLEYPRRDILFYVQFAFLMTFIRELVKDIEDVNGDYVLQMKTLPIILGKKRARNITVFFSIVSTYFLFICIKNLRGSFTEVLALYLIICTCIPMLFFIYKLWNAKTKKEFHFLSNLMKGIMALGILSMSLFKFM